jgi:hypothetical protein
MKTLKKIAPKKAIKKAASKKVVPKAKKKIAKVKSFAASANEGGATINITFSEASNGQAEILLIRDGAELVHEEITRSKTISLGNTIAGDVVVVNGTCAGKTVITISVKTDPVTPDKFNNESFNASYDIV